MPRLAFALFALLSVPASAQPLASDALPGRIGVEPALGEAAAMKGGDAADLHAAWEGTFQWLEGVAFSGQAFGGGAYYARDWFAGSTVGAAADVPVEIVFDRFETTAARVWRRDQGYANGGVGTFRGAAFDVSDPANPRRLNVTFVEDPRLCGSADGVWGPGNDALGCREYLYVMDSDYDGDGSTYAGTAFGFDLDALYVLAARVPDGRALYESNPASLLLDFPPVRFLSAEVTSNGQVELSATFTPRDDLPAGSEIAFRVTPDGGTTSRAPTTHPVGTSPFQPTASLVGLDSGVLHSFQATVEDAGGGVLHESAPVHVRPLLSLNATLVGVWNERGSWADVWGYTAPDGREYALVALQSFGMSVVDVSGPTPVEVGFIPTQAGANDSKDVKVIGHHAYLVNEIGPMQIVDLSDPTAPQQVGLLDTQPGTPNGGAHNVSVDGQYLYVTGGRQSGNAGLRIYSVADPAAPALVGQFRPDHFLSPYYHDFYVDGDVGYAPNIYGGGVDILDLSDRSSPTRVGTFGYPGSGAHNVCGTADGRYVFVGDEIGSSGNWTRIFDVQDPLNVDLEGEIIVDPNAVVHNCYVVGDLLHIGHYTEGYRVFDVRDPIEPVEVAAYDTFTEVGYGFDGVWSIYPYFASGRVAVSDRNGGLFVVELDDSVTTTEPPVPPGEWRVTVSPNPSVEEIVVRSFFPEPVRVVLSLHDARGREIGTVFSGETAGSFREAIPVDVLPSGLYLVRLGVGTEEVTRTITVVR